MNRAKSHFFRTWKYEGSNEHRRSFLTKVFCVLFFQFILMVIVVACGVDVETFYEQARARPRTFIWAFGIVTLFLLFLMIFAWRLKASSPFNMAMVVVLTLMASFYFGSLAAVYHDDGRFMLATFLMLVFSHLALSMLAFVGRFKWWRAVGVSWVMDALVWGAINLVAGFDAKYLISLLFALFFNLYSLFELNRITVRFGFDAVATSVLDIFVDLINAVVFVFYWIGTSVSSSAGKVDMLPYGYRFDENENANSKDSDQKQQEHEQEGDLDLSSPSSPTPTHDGSGSEMTSPQAAQTR